ncbi:complement C1q tumor necrosis factor-related protein 3-like [Brachyistius frenatus]|uniref:complement C1q tumor necrosis factor-related protein 3-like n=1 Tax=Brachyistius frenatus TaxID=100188 RepID=UPI0037E8B35F
MMSPSVPIVLLVCILVRVRAQMIWTGGDGDALARPEKTPEEELRILVQQLAARVQRLEAESENRNVYQAAFSASLVTDGQKIHQGPLDNSTTLVFKKVTTNIGNAYDLDTGVFTAPVKGLYYIRFTGFVGESGTLNAALFKNDQNMFAIYDTRGVHGSSSNGMPLVLETGDRIYITLWAGTSVFDQSRLTTFSGFLISPL